MSAATMNTTIQHSNHYNYFPPSSSSCTSSSTFSSSSSSCTTMISTHETLSQVPNCDISRLSFYLRCCVIGCGLNNNYNNTIIPVELLDFTSAHTLPQQYQHMLCRLSFFERFSLGNLLGSIIHVDNQRQILPDGIATMFVKPGTNEYALCMNQLGVIVPCLPPFYNGNIMICTSEWLQTFHVQPFQRYLATTMMLNTTTTTCTSNNDDYRQDEDDIINNAATTLLVSSRDDHYQEEQDHTSAASVSPQHHHHHNKKVETNVQLDYGCDQQQQDAMDIPMAAAIPLKVDDDKTSSSITMSDDYDCKNNANNSDDDDDVSTSLIVPGQKVRLFGLETEEMNNVIGFVQERKDNRIIVNVPNHSCKYSVRIENLMIIVEEAYAYECCT